MRMDFRGCCILKDVILYQCDAGTLRVLMLTFPRGSARPIPMSMLLNMRLHGYSFFVEPKRIRAVGVAAVALPSASM